MAYGGYLNQDLSIGMKVNIWTQGVLGDGIDSQIEAFMELALSVPNKSTVPPIEVQLRRIVLVFYSSGVLSVAIYSDSFDFIMNNRAMDTIWQDI